MSSAPKPTELRIGSPKAFDGSYEKAIPWLNSVVFYLAVNDEVYNTDAKKIAFALSYMTEGPALTWATTFRHNALIGTTIAMGTFSVFVANFKTAFEHHDVKSNAIAWLSTKRMVKKPRKDGRRDEYSPPLTEYTSLFQNHVAMSSISDENVLIGYYSTGIPPALMRRIMSMDTIPTTIDSWYKKAIHFQTQWDRADEIARRNVKPSHSYQTFSPSPSKSRDPNAMDIDAIKISKLTPEERKRCQEKGLCFRCRKSGHLSNVCPTFPSEPKKPAAKRVQRVEEETPALIELDDDDEETVRRISFSLDF